MQTRRILFRCFLIGALLSVLIVLVIVFVVYPLNPQLLIDIRYGLFGRIVDSPQLAELPPSQLRADGFLEDHPREIEAWRSRMLRELDFLAELPADFDGRATLEKAKWLAARMSGGGGAGVFADGDLLIDKLRAMPSGVGKCSDYVEGFQSLCSVFGINSFEFSITHHTVAAVHCPELAKWIFIDPQFCLLAKDSSGQYVSPVEMRKFALAGGRLDFHFFGDPARQFARLNPQTLGYYDAVDDFFEFVMPYGNNIFAVDAKRTSLRWVPKPLRQLWYKWIGLMPDYMILRDANTRIPARILPLRIVSIVVLLCLTLLCFPYLALRIWDLSRRFLGTPASPELDSDRSRVLLQSVRTIDAATKP